MEVLDEPTWRARASAHAARVDPWIQPHLARRQRREKHPVHDFLFTYYSQRPAALRRWHPGFGVCLAAAPEYAEQRPYARIVRGSKHDSEMGNDREEGYQREGQGAEDADTKRQMDGLTCRRRASSASGSMAMASKSCRPQILVRTFT